MMMMMMMTNEFATKGLPNRYNQEILDRCHCVPTQQQRRKQVGQPTLKQVACTAIKRFPEDGDGRRHAKTEKLRKRGLLTWKLKANRSSRPRTVLLTNQPHNGPAGVRQPPLVILLCTKVLNSCTHRKSGAFRQDAIQHGGHVSLETLAFCRIISMTHVDSTHFSKAIFTATWNKFPLTNPNAPPSVQSMLGAVAKSFHSFILEMPFKHAYRHYSVQVVGLTVFHCRPNTPNMNNRHHSHILCILLVILPMVVCLRISLLRSFANVQQLGWMWLKLQVICEVPIVQCGMNLEVQAGYKNATRNSFPHACNNNSVCVLADVLHVMKNVCNHLIKGQSIVLPKYTVNKLSLPCRYVSVQSSQRLVDYQKDKDLKLAQSLTAWQDEVSHAMNTFSKSVSTALHVMVESNGWEKDTFTTAWFLETMNRWFNLMSSRCI